MPTHGLWPQRLCTVHCSLAARTRWTSRVTAVYTRSIAMLPDTAAPLQPHDFTSCAHTLSTAKSAVLRPNHSGSPRSSSIVRWRRARCACRSAAHTGLGARRPLRPLPRPALLHFSPRLLRPFVPPVRSPRVCHAPAQPSRPTAHAGIGCFRTTTLPRYTTHVSWVHKAALASALLVR